MKTRDSTEATLIPELTPRVPGATRPRPTAASPLALARFEVGDLRRPGTLERLRLQVARDGLALFDGGGDRRALLNAAKTVLVVTAHPDADADGVTTITDLGPAGDDPGARGFSHRALPPHTDRTGVRNPPGLVLLTCAAGVFVGGESLLTDDAAVHADLAHAHPDAIEVLHRPHSALYGGAAGHLGAVFTHHPGPPPSCRVRLRLDDLAEFSPDVQAHLETLVAVIEGHTIRLTLTPGRGYLLDNHRWLHGRSSFSGARTLYRVLGDPKPDSKIGTGIPGSA